MKIRAKKVYVMIDRENYPEKMKKDVYEHEVGILQDMYGEKNVTVMDEHVRKVNKHSGNMTRIQSVMLEFEDEMARMRELYGAKYEHMARSCYRTKEREGNGGGNDGG